MRHSPEFAIGVQVYRAAIVDSYRDVQLLNHPFQSQKKAQNLGRGGGFTQDVWSALGGGEGLRRDGLFGVLTPIRL